MQTIIEKSFLLIKGMMVTATLQKDEHDEHFVQLEAKEGNTPKLNEKFVFQRHHADTAPIDAQKEKPARIFYEKISREYCLEWYLGGLIDKFYLIERELKSGTQTITHLRGEYGC